MQPSKLLLLLLLTFSVPVVFGQMTADEYYKRADERKRGGHAEAAIADYTKAIELDPSLAEAFMRRAALRGAKSDYDGAIADNTKAIELNPNLAAAYVG